MIMEYMGYDGEEWVEVYYEHGAYYGDGARNEYYSSSTDEVYYADNYEPFPQDVGEVSVMCWGEEYDGTTVYLVSVREGDNPILGCVDGNWIGINYSDDGTYYYLTEAGDYIVYYRD